MLAHHLTLLGILTLTACASLRGVPHQDGFVEGRVITAAEIQRSGASDAWDVLRRSGTQLRMTEQRGSQGERIANRGRASVHLTESPLVVLDGVKLADFLTLRSIPAVTIFSIRILSGIEGTRYHGTGAANGVIEITTKRGPEL